jgi:hypothetical protein
MNFDDLLTAVVFFLVLGSFVWWIRSQVLAKKARRWPTTEATIESSSMEVMARERGVKVTLPVFAFSYCVDDEFYGGKFALLPYTTDPGESILTRMIGRKLMIHYDPKKPSTWFIPDELVEGCQVEQKIGAHLVDHSPN